jgi:hypothetical protein
LEIETSDIIAYRRAAAIGLEVETFDGRAVNAIGLEIEYTDDYVRPDVVVECAPEVDSSHSPVTVADNAGAMLFALPETDTVSASDNIGPVLAANDSTAEVDAADNYGPTIWGAAPLSTADTTPNAGATVSGEFTPPQADATDNSGPLLLAGIPLSEAAVTDNAGAMVSGGITTLEVDTTPNAGPAVSGEAQVAETATSPNTGPFVSADIGIPVLPVTPNVGPLVGIQGTSSQASTTDNSGPLVLGEITPAEAATSDNSGPTVAAGTPETDAASSDNSGPVILSPETSAEVAGTDNSGPTVWGEFAPAEASASDNSGPLVLALPETGEVDAIDNSGPELCGDPGDSAHIPAVVTPQTQTPVKTYDPSHYSSQGMTIAVYRPSIAAGSYSPEALFLFNLESISSGWTHSISIDGGYTTAQLTLNVSDVDLSDWLESGIGRHIVAFGDANDRLWEGFVNQVEVRIGALVFTRGPLMDVANRVLVNYAPLTYGPDGIAVTGATTPTLLADNTESQALFGILEGILSAGTCQESDAELYRDTYLAENGYPQQSKDISIGGGSQASVTLSLLGYGAFLDRFVYTNSSVNFQTITNKIKAVLAADPNGFWFDVTGVGENAYLTLEGVEDRQTMGGSIIQGLKELGDVNDLPWTFGIYANRRPVYAAQETDYSYYQRLGDPSQRVRDANGNWIRPWNVVPGKWLFIEDLMVGYPRAGNPRQEPRALYIEEVTYTAPWGLQLRGSCGGGRLKQYLAKLSLSGKGG